MNSTQCFTISHLTIPCLVNSFSLSLCSISVTTNNAKVSRQQQVHCKLFKTLCSITLCVVDKLLINDARSDFSMRKFIDFSFLEVSTSLSLHNQSVNS